MSESWKNRLWSLLLVCTFAFVLSVCNKAINNSSGGSSSSGTAFADGSTVTISSIPFSKINAMISCGRREFSNGSVKIKYCDATDSTTLNTSDDYSITLENLVASGFQICGMAYKSTGGTYSNDSILYGGHFFCK